MTLMSKPYHYPLPYQIRADLFLHLSTMERAGLPALDAYASLRLPRLYQRRLDGTRKMLARGANPAFAGEVSGLFTPLEAALLRAALAAGSPAQSYRRLADNYAKKVTQIRQIKSRLAMPVLVLTLALLIGPLPALIGGTLTAEGYLLQVLRPLLVLGGLAYLIKVFPAWFQRGEPSPARTAASRILLGLPLFGPMHARRNARDFFESLALLLEAGAPMFDAVPVALATVDNRVIQAVFGKILPRMEKGATLAQALTRLQYIDQNSLIGMVQTGEASGTLPEMLWRHVQGENDNIANFQEQMAQWLPRLFYGLVMAWMAYGLISSHAFMPAVPADL
jgi:general secretion pathway protein F